MSAEFEMLLKGVSMSYFKGPFKLLPGGTYIRKSLKTKIRAWNVQRSSAGH